MPKGHTKKSRELICQTCNNIFEAKHYAAKYCSKECKINFPGYKERQALNTKKSSLVRLYGITLEDYQACLQKQNYVCAICKKESNQLYVDHCHTTNLFRGLLCMNCNTGLGQFKDNISFLNSAVNYLEVAELKKTR